MRKLALFGALALAACGLKAPPTPTPTTGEGAPRIAALEHTIEGNVLHLRLRLEGGEDGVGYQVDRAELDPICGCLTPWRRYFEDPPRPALQGKWVERNFPLSSTTTRFYRVRAVDGRGHLGPWHGPFSGRAPKP